MTKKPKDVWQTIRCLDGRNPPGKNNEALVIDGVAYTSDRDKADEFAKTYKSFSILPVSKEDRKLRRTVRNRYKKKPDTSEASECDIKLEELERTINQTNLNKAAGEDRIPYEFLKHLGTKAKGMLLTLFNKCWKGDNLPRSWLTAILKPLLKPGKDAKLTKSYRPISLTSCMGKLLEKIVATRLSYILEQRGLLNDAQAGFRPNRNTSDQVLRLTQSATDQIHQKSGGNATIATFYDCEKAFDKVWRKGLLFKMQQLDIPYQYIRYVRSFLSGRKAKVEVNNVRGKTIHLNQGLPQGSAISPLLFIIFVNDLTIDLDPKTKASLFADDTATWMQDGKIKDTTRTLLQNEIDSILKWAKKWKMAVNTDKTKYMVISSSNEDCSWQPHLEGNGHQIEPVTDYKFLGVEVDQGLRFTKHIETIICKGKKRVNIMKCLAGKDWGASMEQQRTIYIQFVRTILEYGSEGWSSWLAASNMERLEKIQNEALRAASRIAKGCPIDFLRLESNVEPLSVRLQKNDEILWDKYERLPETDSRKQLIQIHVPPRLTTRHGFRNTIKPRMAKWADLKRDITTGPTAPWLTLDNIDVQYVPLEKKKSEYTAEELREAANSKIAEYDVPVKIFVDGSTSGNQQNGGAGIFVTTEEEELHTESLPAGRFCSSFSAECCAFLRALTWIQQESHPAQTVLVLTDSMSMTKAIEANDPKDNDPWMKQIKEAIIDTPNRIILLWIPSHCGVDGNEKADELADKGTLLDQTETIVTHSIIKAKIRNRKWEPTHDRARATYAERRKPKDIEKSWPKHVRSAYAKLRTGHSKDLREYRHRIGIEEDPYCPCGSGEAETIEHVICKCPRLEGRRRLMGMVSTNILVEDPETCRSWLALLYDSVRLKEPDRNDDQAGPNQGHPGPTH